MQDKVNYRGKKFLTLISLMIHGPFTKMTASHHFCLLLPNSYTHTHTHFYTNTNKACAMAQNRLATHDTDDFYHVPVGTSLVFLSGVMMPHGILMQHSSFNHSKDVLHGWMEMSVCKVIIKAGKPF